jgi:SAM-dependent methyltransferase
MISTSAEISAHEGVIGSFYGSFPYPWRPMFFESISDPKFYPTLVRQEIARPELGDFKEIWVAGCGTNQALITALQFPSANVLGTDVSAKSLEICEENARSVGASNLSLRHQGIMQSDLVNQFDLVICTGVIHHNPDPRQCLARLSAALRDEGVLELMVYNVFHRREASAFQEAARIVLAANGGHGDRFLKARSLAKSIGAAGAMADYLAKMENAHESVWADANINPCERSYDVDALWSMAEECGLIIEAPHLNAVDKLKNQCLWTLDISDPSLAEAFFSLDDRSRWQVVNLLRLETSPMLWFYLRPDRNGSGRRVSEVDRNQIFLNSVAAKPSAVRYRYVLDKDGKYHISQNATPLLAITPRPEVRAIWDLADGKRTMRTIFAEINRNNDFNSIYMARLMLTSAEFPHLVMHMPA